MIILHIKTTGHNIKWDNFDILASGKTDYHCKIKETLFMYEFICKLLLDVHVPTFAFYYYTITILFFWLDEFKPLTKRTLSFCLDLNFMSTEEAIISNSDFSRSIDGRAGEGGGWGALPP